METTHHRQIEATQGQTKKNFWLIGRRSNLSTQNKITLYKTVIKPVFFFFLCGGNPHGHQVASGGGGGGKRRGSAGLQPTKTSTITVPAAIERGPGTGASDTPGPSGAQSATSPEPPCKAV